MAAIGSLSSTRKYITDAGTPIEFLPEGVTAARVWVRALAGNAGAVSFGSDPSREAERRPFDTGEGVDAANDILNFELNPGKSATIEGPVSWNDWLFDVGTNDDGIIVRYVKGVMSGLPNVILHRETDVGDVDGPALSVDSEIALFSGTTGKLLKRATGSGIVIVSNGVYSTIPALMSKGVIIPKPTSSDDVAFHHTPVAITISRIYGETDTGTVTFKVFWRAEGSVFTGGTAVHGTGLVADATGEEQTAGFADATIPADSVIAIVTSAVASSPTKFLGLVEFTRD